MEYHCSESECNCKVKHELYKSQGKGGLPEDPSPEIVERKHYEKKQHRKPGTKKSREPLGGNKARIEYRQSVYYGKRLYRRNEQVPDQVSEGVYQVREPAVSVKDVP
jgi:hypothetical protein